VKIAIIVNGISRKKKFFYQSILPGLAAFNTEVFETQHSQHAVTLASGATEAQFDYVLAAGGDGTVNQVVNGILKGRDGTARLPALGVIPLGTGNDFAKLCGTTRGTSIITLLNKNAPVKTDVGKITCLDEHKGTVTRYFINVCSLGMGPEVVKRLYSSKRALGPSVTYFKSIVQTFFSHKPQHLFVKAEDWEWNGQARVVAIANGKTFGHGLYVAPDADANDGIFNTFIAGSMPLVKFLILLQKIKSGKKIADRYLTYNQGTSFEITSPDAAPVEAEGEWVGWLPAKVEVLPGRLNVLR